MCGLKQHYERPYRYQNLTVPARSEDSPIKKEYRGFRQRYDKTIQNFACENGLQHIVSFKDIIVLAFVYREIPP